MATRRGLLRPPSGKPQENGGFKMADATYQPKVYRKQGGEEIVIADGGTLRVESGGTLVLESGSTATLANGIEEPGDIALTTGSIIIGASNVGAALDMKADGAILIGNGTTAAAKTTSGDVKIDNTGAMTIQAKAVKNTMIAAAAGTVLVGTKTSGDVTALDTSAEGAIVIGQGAGETCAAAVLTGDVTMTKAGLTAIGAGKVTSSMLANGAGIAALVTAGGGASASYDKTTSGAQTLLAANGSGEGARTVLIIVTIDETFAADDGTATIFDIGETDSLEKFKANLNSGTAGDILTYAGSLTEEKALLVTATAATGTGAGGISIAVLALPAS